MTAESPLINNKQKVRRLSHLTNEEVTFGVENHPVNGLLKTDQEDEVLKTDQEDAVLKTDQTDGDFD